MLKENDRLYGNFVAIADVFLSLLVFIAAYYLRIYIFSEKIMYFEQYLILFLLIIPVWYILLKIINLQSSHKIKAYSVVILEYILTVITGVSILFVFIFWLKLNNISRIAILVFGVADVLILSVVKIISISIKKKKTLKGKTTKNILIIADENSGAFIEKLINSKQWGYKVFAIATNSKKIIEKFSNEYKIINEGEHIHKLIEEKSIDEIIYCKDNFDKTELKNIIYSCSEVGVNVQIQSDFFSLIASKSHLNYFGEEPVLSISSTSTDYFALTVKKMIDIIFSFLFIIIFFPFLLIIAILIKIDSKGPVFYKSKRVGLRGRIFTMYKFRTMRSDAEKLKKELENLNEVDGPVFKIKNDPRVTKIGKFLRKTSIDEFPQFFNVIKGDMSIVGPRPPIKEEVEQYERWQLRRLSMKPGITCIWQVSGRNDISFEEWMRMDLQYIDNWSLRLDLMLIIRTINVIFKRTGY